MPESCNPAAALAVFSGMPPSPDTHLAGRPEPATRDLTVQPAAGPPQAAGAHRLQRDCPSTPRSCSLCGTGITPLWRQYDGKSTCNACYIYAKRKGGASRPPSLINSAAGPKHARTAAAQPPSAKPRRGPTTAKAQRKAPGPKPVFCGSRAAELLLVRREEPRYENDALVAGELVLLRSGHKYTRAKENLWLAIRLSQACREGGPELVAAHALLALAKGDSPLLRQGVVLRAPRIVS